MAGKLGQPCLISSLRGPGQDESIFIGVGVYFVRYDKDPDYITIFLNSTLPKWQLLRASISDTR